MSTTVLQVLGPLQSRLPTILTRHFSGGVVARPLRGRRGALPKGGADSERGGRGSGERGRTTTFGDLVQSSSLLSKLGIWFLEAGTRGKQRTKLKDLPLPTPIQRLAYPLIGGEDQRSVSMVSPPGTGKTLAYLLPVVDRTVRVSEGLSIKRDEEGRAVRSSADQKTIVRSAGKGSPLLVVIVPTRELAEQAHAEVKKYSPPWMSVQLCAGGTGRDVRDSHVMALSHGADIVVGTPGRLKWLAEHGALSLGKPVARPEITPSPVAAEGLLKKPKPLLPCVVLDEADVLLTSEIVLGLVRELTRGRQAQLIYASATFDAWMKDRLRELSPKYEVLNATEEMEAREEVVYALREVSHLYARLSSNSERRLRQLTWAIEKLRPGSGSDIQVANKVLVYCREKTEVCLLADDPQLRNVCAPGRMMALHADMSPSQRKQVMDSYRTALADFGPVVLITTDIAARGLDIPGIGLVIHYGAPKTTANYIHRVGRIRPETVKKVGRAGEDKCKSIMFLTSGRSSLPPPRIAAQWGVQPAQVKAMVRGILEGLQESTKEGSIGTEAWKTADSLLFGVDDPDVTRSAAAVQNLAAALHLVALRQSPPSARSRPSLLSGRKGYSPVLLLDPYLKKVPSKDRAAKLVSEAIKEAATHGMLEPLTEPVDSSSGRLPSRPEKRISPLGRIALTRRGYAVDIPTGYIKSVLGSRKLRSAGVVPVYLTTQVPRLITDERTFRLRAAARDRREGVQEVVRAKRLRERIMLARWARSALVRLPPAVPFLLLCVSIGLDVVSLVTALLAGPGHRPEATVPAHRDIRLPGLLRLLTYLILGIVAISRLRLWWRDVRVEAHGVVIKIGKAGSIGHVNRKRRGSGSSQLSDGELTAADYDLCRERYEYTPWPPPELLGWAPFGTVPFGPQEDPRACYWAQGNATCFKVRQKGYASTGLKLPSRYPIYECVGVDVVKSGMVLRKVAELSVFQRIAQGDDVHSSEVPSFWRGVHHINGHRWEKEIGIPRFLVVNCQLPYAPPGLFTSADPNDPGMSVLSYFVMNPTVIEEYHNGNLEQISAIRLFKELLKTGVSKKGESALKIIALIENAQDLGLPGIVNRYNGKPALLTKSLQLHADVDGRGEVAEIDFDIRQWCYLARKSFYSFSGLLKDCMAHVGLVMEGEDDSELPEQLLACFRISHLDIARAKLIDTD
ncbi:DEAD box ATP-dependent RNA helicase, putative [Perkinsus marinus ATCC 50983]|uniref:ATP-dependent RNA helicase n=1 Tax=Perkinsus marinus (strain ATCC 50983 / TXsc) TaxID=423536 RepID=C5LTY1_PERM5|nr:DEAD box ATP-dependent RNA helicase, putative [Perkinsus marinus ATCC 50983]EEQ99779.1 DEAD box ATP-dependent RNA helicase, putative [Perkinsus marinus ATCC 50983]|eukprot:XP_002767062.1 DEAD box ATP-dependent RNA helicase, putative [Perkinsus marinus ATCC 50983]